jgi:hypothetical protein
MAGRAASNAVTRYAGIQVQTSSLGLQIPVGWGTFRCRCNLVDYLDFKSTAQKAASGKGGATVTGYAYSATIVLAICEGPIDFITQVWVDAKDYAYNSNGSTVANTANASAASQIGLTLAHGAIGQPVWSYLASAHPDHAIGYSGLAIVYAEHYALDSGASTPDHSFEVVRQAGFAVSGYSGPDIDPSLMIADFFQNTRTGVPSWPASGLLDPVTLTTAPDSYQKYCIASGLLLSPVIDQERSASDALTEYLLATNSTCVWSEGVLKFVPYGDTAVTGNGVTYLPDLTPLYSLNDDDYIVEKAGDDPIKVDIQDQSDAYNVVQLEYLDRTNQYNMAIALASDAANVVQYGARRQDPTTVHSICTPAVAAAAAQLYLQRTLYIRGQYKFKLGWMFALLEPGDLLELTDSGLGLTAYMVRITQIDEDEKDRTLDVTCEDLLVGVANAPLYAMQTGQGTQVNKSVDPGGVEANLLLWSQDFTAWAKSNLTVVAAAAADPITGAADAQKLVPTTTDADHGVSQAVAGFENANYTLTCYLQADEDEDAQLVLGDGGSNAATLSVDLSTGSVLAASASGTAMVVATSLSRVGTSSWYRVQLTASVPATTIKVTIKVLSDTGLSGFAGAGSNGIYLFGAQLTQGVDVRAYAATTTAVCGPQIFNPPSPVTEGGLETWCAVAGGPNWGGANIWVSLDGGDTYELVAETTQGPARFGRLSGAYPAGADPDTADTLAVDLSASGGALTSAADTVADADGTLCLIDNELISFSTATLTGPSRYNLGSYVRRGCLGTAIAAHAAGAGFVRLDAACVALPFLTSQAGAAAYVKFQSFNLWGESATPLSNCVAYPFTPASNPAGPSPNGTTAGGGEIGPTTNPTYVSATDPALAEAIPNGGFWFNSTSGVFYQRHAGAWVGVNQIIGGTVLFSTTGAGNSGAFLIPANGPTSVTILVKGGSGGVGDTGGAAHLGGGGGENLYTAAVVPGSTVINWSCGESGAPSTGAGGAGVASTATSTAWTGTMTGGGGAGGGVSAVGAGGSASGPAGSTSTAGGAGAPNGLGAVTITAN